MLKSNIYITHSIKKTKTKAIMQIFISVILLFLMQKKFYYPDKISEIFIEINLKLFVVLLLMILKILEIIF